MNRTVRSILQPIAVAIGLALLARLALQFYSVPSDSMAPTLLAGDRIVAVRYFRGDPQPGHVIVFTSPMDQREMLVKRIVAVPGDLVDARQGRLRIGGRTVTEPYVAEAAATGEIAALIVPADSYFVLGDNRRASADSRTFGVVPRRAIAGRARMILWSSSGSAERIALARSDGAADPHETERGRRLFKWIQ